MSEIVIVGCGDIGRRVGGILLERGERVLATAKIEEGAAELQEKGFFLSQNEADQSVYRPPFKASPAL